MWRLQYPFTFAVRVHCLPFCFIALHLAALTPRLMHKSISIIEIIFFIMFNGFGLQRQNYCFLIDSTSQILNYLTIYRYNLKNIV